jgi:hypothetical protein
MATNIFFNNFFASGEQDLIESLIVESIKIYGHDVWFMPRTVINEDSIWREGETYDFQQAFELEMYIQDVNGFTGDGKFLSKFGLEIRDEVTFQVALRSYHAEVGSIIQQSRPREGDMIYFPLNDKCFQIKYVDQTPVFYQMGALQMYSLVCELFEYSNETFNTGLPFIDDRYTIEETDELDYLFLLEDGDAFMFEDGSYWVLEEAESEFDLIDPGSQNDEIQDEADKYINWGESNPFSEKY